MKIIPRLILAGMIFLLAGCGGNSPDNTAESLEATQPPIEGLEETFPEDDQITSPITLKVWLPPEFDPTNETPAGILLQAKLDEFSERHPGVRVEVRVKALEGQAGLLESLIAADAAAPLALPDLIALPSGEMQMAAGRKLIHPLDNFLAEDNGDWYDFAKDMGTYQDETYGLGFAGDALIMVYRPIVIEDPPSSWEEIIQNGKVLSFPAADPQALFTVAMYQSLGGELLSETGELQFDPILLERVLEYYQQAENANVMPFWLTQYNSDELSWQEFLGNRAHLTITWATRYFDINTDTIQATPIPTPDGTTQTVATGWVWALTGNDPTRYEIAVELAEFLSEGEFLGEWTSASGYLPTRPSALNAWPIDQKYALASQILSSARAKPDESIFIELGDLLTQAVIGVLKDEISTEEAAKMVVEGLGD